MSILVFTVELLRLYRAKAKALELLGVDYKSSYTKLSRYMDAIIRTNPGSVVDLQYEWVGNFFRPNFKKFFITFNAQRRRFFKGYRQFIEVDDCHLRGLYKGVLLAVMAINTNYGLPFSLDK